MTLISGPERKARVGCLTDRATQAPIPSLTSPQEEAPASADACLALRCRERPYLAKPDHSPPCREWFIIGIATQFGPKNTERSFLGLSGEVLSQSYGGACRSDTFSPAWSLLGNQGVVPAALASLRRLRE